MARKVRKADGKAPPTTAEQELERLASRRHGIVTYADALAAGITPNEFRQRVRVGSLLRMHRGVYRLGHRAPSSLAAYAAAVAACGEGSGVSGFAGSHLLGLTRHRPEGIEVTTTKDRRVPGLTVHRARNASLELTYVRGIAVTSPAWTLLDIAGELGDESLGRACHEAFVRFGLGPERVARLLKQRGPVAGSGRLMAILAGDAPLLLSRLEARFLAILRADRLDIPQTNRHEEEGYVDCRWPRRGLIVELDSYRFHGSRRAWERDRERDRAARRRGEELIRFTYDDVFKRADEIRVQMRTRLVPS